jgi:hypothetical protein
MAQYTYYEDPITGDEYRDGVRNGKFVIDTTLTPLGFSGSESTDEGVTGDWLNLKEYE